MTDVPPYVLDMDRRRVLRSVLVLGTGVLAGVGLPVPGGAMPRKSTVALVKGMDRADGVRAAMAEFDLSRFSGCSVALKANYNSADPFPASTHPDTLRALIEQLKDAGAGPMTLAERSGMGNTREVLEAMGASDVLRETGVMEVNMDTLDSEGYVPANPAASHWERGFLLARAFAEADRVVQTCCLKTHQYGGHFTLALKNAVGAVAKYDPHDGYNYMRELHGSPLQRTLIAEISQSFINDLIVMDGLKAFVTGGPHAGREVEPGVILASPDPVAIDAVGVAILRLFGTTPEVEAGPVFEQEQIRRAAELGLGAAGPDEIELVALGPGAREMAQQIRVAMA